MNEINEFIKDLIDEEVLDKEAKRNIKIYNEKTRDEKEVIRKCPKCGNNIYESEKGYYCCNKDCKFAFYKGDKFFVDRKIKLTKFKVKELLKNSRVKFDKIYSSKKDTYYSAEIGYKINGDYVNYELIFK